MADGLDPSASIPLNLDKEKLREKRGRRAILIVRIVDRIRVELDLVVVEVQDRRVVEAIVRIRIFVFTHLGHRSSKAQTHILTPEFYSATPKKLKGFALDKNKQYLFIVALSSKP